MENMKKLSILSCVLLLAIALLLVKDVSKFLCHFAVGKREFVVLTI